MRKFFFAAAGSFTLLTSQLASADDPTKQQCIDADTQAQSLRSEDKLAATRAALLICSNPACPAMVRDDCAQRIDELNRVEPSIVFSVKSGAGADLTDVKVTMDEKPLTAMLDGRPIAIDPGNHTFVFNVQGEEPVSVHFLVVEGEKNRHESITIGKAPAIPVADGSAGDRGETADSSAGRTQRILGLVGAGVGVAGIAVGTIFGLSATSSWSSAQNACNTTSCPGSTRPQAESDRASALDQSTISTIAFISGGALLVSGAIVFFTAPKKSGTTIGFAPTLGGGVIRGTF